MSTREESEFRLNNMKGDNERPNGMRYRLKEMISLLRQSNVSTDTRIETLINQSDV